STCIISRKTDPHEARLAHVGQAFKKILTRYEPRLVALESLFFSKNQRTAMGVARSAGVAFYVAGVAGIPVVEYTPQEVKLALTGYGRAEKSGVEKMIRLILQDAFPRKPLDDEVDAIAVALTASAHARARR
ncbi:MAG: crossover junction endodeoxyribonuclease RuvC, partial [Parcubacteria group bacterium]|nr:crossover junction endodeoxyribonuclease RuvC [Parcubacteria group bacterium]